MCHTEPIGEMPAGQTSTHAQHRGHFSASSCRSVCRGGRGALRHSWAVRQQRLPIRELYFSMPVLHMQLQVPFMAPGKAARVSAKLGMLPSSAPSCYQICEDLSFHSVSTGLCLAKTPTGCLRQSVPIKEDIHLSSEFIY